MGKKQGNLSLSCSKWFWPRCISTYLLAARKRPTVGSSQRQCDPSTAKSQKASNQPIRPSSSAHGLPYISHPASLIKWCMSRRLINNYRAVSDCRRRRSSFPTPCSWRLSTSFISPRPTEPPRRQTCSKRAWTDQSGRKSLLCHFPRSALEHNRRTKMAGGLQLVPSPCTSSLQRHAWQARKTRVRQSACLT